MLVDTRGRRFNVAVSADVAVEVSKWATLHTAGEPPPCRGEIDAEARPVEFEIMEWLNALPKYGDAGRPFGPIQFVSGNNGVWAVCPRTGFGFWYHTLPEAIKGGGAFRSLRLTAEFGRRRSSKCRNPLSSTFQLFAMYPDEESARVYLEDRLWPNGPVCPDCKSGERVSALGVCATRKPGFYRCLACAFDFTIRTNTIFERSKVPLHKWLYSMYLLVTAHKGIIVPPTGQGNRGYPKDGVVYPRSPA